MQLTLAETDILFSMWVPLQQSQINNDTTDRTKGQYDWWRARQGTACHQVAARYSVQGRTQIYTHLFISSEGRLWGAKQQQHYVL